MRTALTYTPSREGDEVQQNKVERCSPYYDHNYGEQDCGNEHNKPRSDWKSILKGGRSAKQVCMTIIINVWMLPKGKARAPCTKNGKGFGKGFII